MIVHSSRLLRPRSYDAREYQSVKAIVRGYDCAGSREATHPPNHVAVDNKLQTLVWLLDTSTDGQINRSRVERGPLSFQEVPQCSK